MNKDYYQFVSASIDFIVTLYQLLPKVTVVMSVTQAVVNIPRYSRKVHVILSDFKQT
jgi:hypothetical protein